MKILIITQSSKESGKNYWIAESYQYWIQHEYRFKNIKPEIEILNVNEIENQDIQKAEKIIMIVPEWNSSFPASFKSMIDNSGWPSVFQGKSCFLIGTSATTFGNIVGINHLEHILNWIGVQVYNKKIYIPEIQNLALTVIDNPYINKTVHLFNIENRFQEIKNFLY